jgi:hypothetical protein
MATPFSMPQGPASRNAVLSSQTREDVTAGHCRSLAGEGCGDRLPLSYQG